MANFPIIAAESQRPPPCLCNSSDNSTPCAAHRMPSNLMSPSMLHVCFSHGPHQSLLSNDACYSPHMRSITCGRVGVDGGVLARLARSMVSVVIASPERSRRSSSGSMGSGGLAGVGGGRKVHTTVKSPCRHSGHVRCGPAAARPMSSSSWAAVEPSRGGTAASPSSSSASLAPPASSQGAHRLDRAHRACGQGLSCARIVVRLVQAQARSIQAQRRHGLDRLLAGPPDRPSDTRVRCTARRVRGKPKAANAAEAEAADGDGSEEEEERLARGVDFGMAFKGKGAKAKHVCWFGRVEKLFRPAGKSGQGLPPPPLRRAAAVSARTATSGVQS